VHVASFPPPGGSKHHFTVLRNVPVGTVNVIAPAQEGFGVPLVEVKRDERVGNVVYCVREEEVGLVTGMENGKISVWWNER
jgi:hypothetical protein